MIRIAVLLVPLTVLAAASSGYAATLTNLPAPPGVNPGDTYHRIFVTSFDVRVVTIDDFPPVVGELGSVKTGDWNVNYAAFQAGLLPGWNGTDLPWKAILSDLKTAAVPNAKDHINIQGPIYNMHDELVANDAADLWDGTLAHAIKYEEYGVAVAAGTRVWTGTNTDGTTAGSFTADGWSTPNSSVFFGNPLSSASQWIDNGGTRADISARLYGISDPLIALAPELGQPAVPEPSTFALAVLALVPLGLRAWRCRRLPPA